MSYNPPTPENWTLPFPFDERFKVAYDNGADARAKGLLHTVNPHHGSDQHRVMAEFEDEMHYWWFMGWLAKQEGVYGLKK